MAEHHFQPRDIVFNEGESADHAFVIRSGQVEILKKNNNGEVRLATLHVGEVFGEMALFDLNGTRSATARAVTETMLDVLSQNEFEDLLSQCPPRVLPIIKTIVDRLRASNRRVSEKEQASVLLESEIEKITIKPACELLGFTPMEALVARLPFRIGSYGAGGMDAKNRQNHLNIQCLETPLLISKQHCQIEIIDNGLFLNDLGSRHTTVVNGRNIGRGKGLYRLPLQKGENEIILGGFDSPYKILMICE
jgi:CRP/FNR family cyclic AMP-dependent transcriptional regulator